MNGLLNISPVYASILVVMLPFFGFLMQAVLGKKSNSGNIGLATIILSVCVSFFAVFLPVWNGAPLTERMHWFTVGGKPFYVGVMLNNLTVLMQLIVGIIALPVHIYSRAYMRNDPGIHRYWMFLSFFCFAMLGLTISTSLLQLYVFWELVGFASYLLIGFWFTKESAVQANKKAFIINRIGDIGFLIGIALVYTHCGTVDLGELFGPQGVFLPAVNADGSWLTLAGLAFFLGAMAKSAQFPLHVWLPDAMEGPTSVSSLIHAATMVAAGVFLLCTIFPLFNETVLLTIAIIGCITALSAAIFALGQYDIKKILAFSTISQLGFMMVGVGIGSWDTAMFHLATHAFFKCLLFLAAGAVIHEMAHFKATHQLDIDPQDLRNMGGLRRYLPTTFVCMTIASLALAGFPLTTGYLSKDSIVVQAFEWGFHLGGIYLLIPTTLAAVSLLTAFYIGRLLFKTFFGKFKFAEKLQKGELHDAPIAMTGPMIFLAACCLFPTCSFHPFDYHQSWLLGGFHVKTAFAAVAEMHSAVPLVLTLGALAAWGVGWRWYVAKRYPLSKNNRWVRFATRQGYFNEFYQLLFVKGTEQLSRGVYAFDHYVVDGLTRTFSAATRRLSVAAHWFDRHMVDGLVNLIAGTTYYVGHLVRHVQNGQLQSYLGFALTVVVLGILYLIIK
ncbi:NADH dehydrogenase subunit L [Sphingobacterium allocomposti]|uniref:NADH dehydrogenase subunit L n=1 Tax=Sphingobacterium allocomposti TaxID=415956 RepID=A0A5S5DAA6_9SPHI|nr:NADH-quinone oxidoreductase subunit L [Sphingobacterium composti Yoo et al. 2007 non Ten et al. 2007]TYP92993.1 NADH dehydrogenase subunit L [Sphingobacterium composti Yoo et al. 2007 non Ten et al. 2007]